MKSFITAVLAFTFATAASADSLVPRVSMIALKGNSAGVEYKAVVDNYGLLKVTSDKKVLVTKKLQQQTFYALNSLAYSLGNAEIKVEKQTIVCMLHMMVMRTSDLFVSSFDDNGMFTGKLQETLSEEGCWISRHAYPVIEEDRQAARELKKLVEILVYEHAQLN
jgi:hypothetical protein